MSSYAAPAPPTGLARDGGPAAGVPAGSGTQVSGRPGGPSGVARLLALLFWVVLPALAITGIVLGARTWASHADSAPPGVPGEYQVENRSCTGGICVQTGTFTSADGQFVQTNVFGYSGWEAGTRHKVVYDPSTPDLIVPVYARWDPTATIAALTGAFGVLGVWGWFAFGARRTPSPHVALA